MTGDSVGIFYFISNFCVGSTHILSITWIILKTIILKRLIKKKTCSSKADIHSGAWHFRELCTSGNFANLSSRSACPWAPPPRSPRPGRRGRPLPGAEGTPAAGSRPLRSLGDAAPARHVVAAPAGCGGVRLVERTSQVWHPEARPQGAAVGAVRPVPQSWALGWGRGAVSPRRAEAHRY